MAYLNFLLIYLGLPVLILALTLPRSLPIVTSKRVAASLLAITLLTFFYTAPLVSYLVHRGVWWYEVDRLFAVLGYAPVEEYLFFALLPLCVGLLLFHVLGREQSWMASNRFPSTIARPIGLLLYGTLSFAGIAFLVYGGDRMLLLGLTLAWASPVLFVLWALGGHYLWGALRKPLLITVGVSTVYFLITAWAALMQYIRIVSRAYTLWFTPLGLPIEEVVFFLLISLLVTTSLLLLLLRDQLTELQRVN